ncbi:MAG TPA: hypothetical protein VK747_00065, partial [Blastocatellia bacterium]|nr:hypothetical protein [Blastocatellia bacterium]
MMNKTKRASRSHARLPVLMLMLTVFANAQTPYVTSSRPASDPSLQRLEREIARLAKVSGGVVGAT